MSPFSKIKFEHWMIVFSIAGILALYVLSLNSQPIDVPLNEIANYDGREISVRGAVTFKQPTKTGMIFDISENNYTIMVYVGECNKEIEIGDYVKVTGRVQKYNDKYEIMALNDDKITVLICANNTIGVIQNLVEDPLTHLNNTVNIFGFVEYEPLSYNNKTTFFLTDDALDGKYSIKVASGLNDSIHKGDSIVLTGTFRYDGQNSRYYVQCISLEIKQSWGVWRVSISELAGYSGSYENAKVNISGEVLEINATYLRLTDENNRYNIRIIFANDTIISAPLSIGDTVSVEGIFAYNKTAFNYVITGKNISKKGA
ncbi:MAG: OB-fold nucleic acid binding domain-containing protein [Thermoplasmata archaeon]